MKNRGMKRLRHGLAVSGAVLPMMVAGFSLATAQTAAVSDDVIKIGLIEDMSGVYADITGIGAVTGAQMAVEEFGGKVLGKPIEVVYADHQNKADIGGAIARKWFDAEKVDAILDVASSSPALAALEVAKEKKKIIALSSPGSVRITNDACGPYVIHWAYDSYAIAHSTGTALVKQGNDSWYFIVADYAFGHSLAKDTGDVVKANGGKVVGSTRLPVGTNDFASALLQAQGSGAKVVALAKCRQRHHQFRQAGGAVRRDAGRPEARHARRLHQRCPWPRPEGGTGPHHHRSDLLGHE